MTMKTKTSVATAATALVAVLSLSHPTLAHEEHEHGDEVEERMHTMHEMMEEHHGHDHEHAFQAMEDRTPEHMRRDMEAMMELGLAVPPMDGERGRALFLEKGCIACHSVNGVGGEMGPSLNAADMPHPMNAFEFSARMWRGAAAMIELQTQLFGEPISLSGQELADIVAFAHDEHAQAGLTEDQVPEEYRQLIGH